MLGTVAFDALDVVEAYTSWVYVIERLDVIYWMLTLVCSKEHLKLFRSTSRDVFVKVTLARRAE